jgi:hypothetical protein
MRNIRTLRAAPRRTIIRPDRSQYCRQQPRLSTPSQLGPAQLVAQPTPRFNGLRKRRPQTLIHPISPVRGCNGDHQLHDLLLVQVLEKRLQIDLVDIARESREQVSESQYRPLSIVKQHLVSLRPRLAKGSDLLVRHSSSLRRSVM